MFIDSHAHLEGKRYDSDRDEVLARAKQNGIEALSGHRKWRRAGHRRLRDSAGGKIRREAGISANLGERGSSSS